MQPDLQLRHAPRSEQRMTVLLSAEVETAFASFTARICDLSRHGLRAMATRAVPVGTLLTVRRGTLSLTGAVVWSQGRQFGMRFDAALRATDLLVQVSRSRSALTR
jgi:hypothetical protein